MLMSVFAENNLKPFNLPVTQIYRFEVDLGHLAPVSEVAGEHTLPF
jgi:hypothetical protein